MRKYISFFLSTSVLFTSFNLFASSVNDDDDSASNFSGLTHLPTLHLSSNQLIEAPVISGLRHLPTLHLSSNRLREAPVISGLRHLPTLHLSSNRLIEAPVISAEWLRRLDLYGIYCFDLYAYRLNSPAPAA